jgi:hypothetical protein
MQPIAPDTVATHVPKTRQRHHSYDEGTDEPPGLIEHEPVDVEEETPAEENEPVQGNEEEDDAAPSAFEEE